MASSDSHRGHPTGRATGTGSRAAGIIPCAKHGPSDWCYVQHDGSHIDSHQCRCFLIPSEYCPVDVHREAALAFAGNVAARLIIRAYFRVP